jgi:hypothetical protein
VRVVRRRRRRRSGVETTFFSYNGVHEKMKPIQAGVKGDDPLASLRQFSVSELPVWSRRHVTDG